LADKGKVRAGKAAEAVEAVEAARAADGAAAVAAETRGRRAGAEVKFPEHRSAGTARLARLMT
jgi:hypothetical protein